MSLPRIPRPFGPDHAPRLEHIFASCISPWIVGRTAVVWSMPVPVPAASCIPLNLHKNATDDNLGSTCIRKWEHYSLEGTIFSPTTSSTILRFIFSRKQICAQKFAPGENFLLYGISFVTRPKEGRWGGRAHELSRGATTSAYYWYTI